MYILAIVLYFASVFLYVGFFYGSLSSMFFNPAVILIMLLITIPFLAAAGLLKEIKKIFQFAISGKRNHFDRNELHIMLEAVKLTKQLLLMSGVIVFILSMITLLMQLSDLASIGPNISTALLSILYSVFGVLLFLPIEAKMKAELCKNGGDKTVV